MMINGADVAKIMRTPTELALLMFYASKERQHFLETELKYRSVLMNPEDDEARTSFNQLLSDYWDSIDPTRKKERVSFADKIKEFDNKFKDKPIVFKQE